MDFNSFRIRCFRQLQDNVHFSAYGYIDSVQYKSARTFQFMTLNCWLSHSALNVPPLLIIRLVRASLGVGITVPVVIDMPPYLESLPSFITGMMSSRSGRSMSCWLGQ